MMSTQQPNFELHSLIHFLPTHPRRLAQVLEEEGRTSKDDHPSS